MTSKICLNLCQLKHEVFGEPLKISSNLFVESLGWHFIKVGQIKVHYDLETTNQVDSLLDNLD